MYIAVDIGGTNIRVASVENLRNPTFSNLEKFQAVDDYEKDLAAIRKVAESFGGEIDGVGFAIAGRVNANKDSASTANLPSWKNKPIKRDLGEMLGCEVALENDAACAALAEAYFGEGKGKDFFFMIWGTGVGGAEIKTRDGKAEVHPFEPGHEIIIEEGGRLGACGHRGDLEAYAGGASIQGHYKKKAVELSETEWKEVVGCMAKGIKILLDKKPNDLIIFGGGIAINQPDKIQMIREIITKDLGNKAPELRISRLGDDAGLYGALSLLT